MQHSFDIAIAEKYGINSAVLLNSIYFWIEKNRANNKHYYDGNFWTYNSKKGFSEMFPYMTARQVDYALKKLIEDDILVVGNYNTKQLDHTLWYAITDKGYSILQNCSTDCTKLLNRFNKIVEPIPDINIYKKKEIYKEKRIFEDDSKLSEELCTSVEELPTSNVKKRKSTSCSFADADSIICSYGFTQNIIDEIHIWLQYKKEKGQGYKPIGLKTLCKQILGNVNANGEEHTINCIDACIGRNYAGIFWNVYKGGQKTKIVTLDEVKEIKNKNSEGDYE